MSDTWPGDSKRITREYFDSLLIEMRHFGAVLPETSMNLYGEKFDTPIMTAALSHLDNLYEGGLAEMAKGAKAANACMWAGWGDDDELERITATGAKTIKIIKPKVDEDIVFHRIKHAEKCGCIAVGMDLDHAFNGVGGYDVLSGVQMIGKSLHDVKRYVNATKLPFIIKGVLSVHDAVKCVEAGVQGIVVSHHSGIMNYAVPPLMVLPKIVEAVGGKMKIFVDCGLESGYDVFKALALGADAISLGRVMLDSFSKKGAPAVTEMIQNMTGELAGIMAKTCSPNITSIDPTLIHKTR